MARRPPQRSRAGVRLTKVGLPLLAHALLVAAVVAELAGSCDGENALGDRLVQSGAIVAGLAMFANLVLYFPRDRWSLLGKQACVALLVTGGAVMLVTFGHCAFA